MPSFGGPALAMPWGQIIAVQPMFGPSYEYFFMNVFISASLGDKASSKRF